MNFKIKNPLSEKWYADPESRFYNGKYYIYVTRSDEFKKQLNHDCFISENLTDWEKVSGTIDMSGYPWVKEAVWAPTIIERNNLYYYIFASNNIHKDHEGGGLEIGVSESPEGPFKNYLGHSLVDCIINGAQPIDAHLFKDDDGTVYLYFGGWGHCNMCIMNDKMDGFVPFEDGSIFREVTPNGYVEGPCMMKKDGKYYFMWSSGSWTDGTYRVDYSISSTPFGPFTVRGTMLTGDGKKYNGTGHHGYLYIPEENLYLCVYHRRKINVTDRDARFLCIDRMDFDGDNIIPVVLTDEWEYKSK